METDLFRTAVTTVLNNWTALQLAVEHGMGNRDIALGLVDYVIETFTSNDDISTQEMADVLAEVMDSLFQTICEDNSPDEVGALLWRFYQFHRVGNNDKIRELLAKLPPCQAWLSKPLDNPIPVKTCQLQPVQEDMDAEVSEWTQVKTRSSRRILNSSVEGNSSIQIDEVDCAIQEEEKMGT